MSKNELQASDTAQDDGEEYQNITASSIGTKRGINVVTLGDGSITDVNGNPIQWTTVTQTVTSPTVDTFTYSNSGGDLVIYTVTYTDSSHDVLVTVVKTAP